MGKHNHGFALVALAAMLVVGSLAITGALLTRDADARWEPRLALQDRQRDVAQALLQYQRTYHRLPCPASQHLPPGDALYGSELAGCSEGTASAGIARFDVGGAAVRSGMLPVRTLGLADRYAEDGWGGRLRYVMVEALSDPFRFSDRSGVLTVLRGSDTLTSNAGYVLVSHGRNHYGAYATPTGAAMAPCAGANAQEQENCDDDGTFLIADIGDGFDDMLHYAPADAVAQAQHIPCYSPRTASPFRWGGGCAGSFTAVLDGGSQPIANTAPGYTGNAAARCDNGVLLVEPGSTCDAIPAPQPCALPWGGTLGHGDSVTAYQAAASACYGSCVSETRQCNDGVLSGSYTQPGCSVTRCWKPKGLGVWIGALLCWTPTPNGTSCTHPGQYCNGDYAACDGCLPLPHYFRCE